MRTTLTLDDDVAAKLKAESRRLGRPFRDVVNEALRRGLAHQRTGGTRQPFKVKSARSRQSQAGLSLDNIAELIAQVEGPLHG
jgi:hypothetical protein